MTSTVTITAHPAKSKDGRDLKVEVVEFEDDYVIARKTELKYGETYSCAVWEGRSVTITETPD